MSKPLDPDALFARGFKAGSIVRLSMKNFLTYDECEVYPGPRLNIVIGPNGTGKSALTHAICLACCGSTGDVGEILKCSYFRINDILTIYEIYRAVQRFEQIRKTWLRG